MTTPPGDPTSPSYGRPTSDPYGPGSGYEGATNGFGQPFVPLEKEPSDVERAAAARAAQAQWAAQQPPAPGGYGGPAPYGQQPNQYAQPGPYGQPGYPPYGAVPPYFPQVAPRNGMATAGFVLGIISIPGVLFSFFDIPIAIVGLILSIVALKRSKRMNGLGAVLAGWGIGLSIAGLVLSSALSIWLGGRMIDCADRYEVGTDSWQTCVIPEE